MKMHFLSGSRIIACKQSSTLQLDQSKEPTTGLWLAGLDRNGYYQFMAAVKDEKELAFLYDLYIAPLWRERFDRLLDAEVTIQAPARILDAECGTGGFALELAARHPGTVEVFASDHSLERLELARAKATTQKLEGLAFKQTSLLDLQFDDSTFDVAIGDASMISPADLKAALSELRRVTRGGGTVAIKLATRGSFDEFFSIYWEALHDLGLDRLTPDLERLITERPTVGNAEEIAEASGLKRVHSVTRKERFDYDNAAAFLADPLIENAFLDEWLEILPDEDTRQRVLERLNLIIDRERGEVGWDISIKATIVIGVKSAALTPS
jgi:ubiquinone/menaquinone biosynthesis C-methylase UbiE